MSKIPTVVWRITGSVIGLFAGWLAMGLIFYHLIYRATNGWESEHGATAVLAAIPGYLLGSPLGAAAGGFLAQRILRQKASFWWTLAGGAAGLVIGGVLAGTLLLLSNSLGMDWWQQDTEMVVLPTVASIFVVAGAVIESGRKARPANAAKSNAQSAEKERVAVHRAVGVVLPLVGVPPLLLGTCGIFMGTQIEPPGGLVAIGVSSFVMLVGSGLCLVVYAAACQGDRWGGTQLADPSGLGVRK